MTDKRECFFVWKIYIDRNYWVKIHLKKMWEDWCQKCTKVKKNVIAAWFLVELRSTNCRLESPTAVIIPNIKQNTPPNIEYAGLIQKSGWEGRVREGENKNFPFFYIFSLVIRIRGGTDNTDNDVSLNLYLKRRLLCN